MKSHVVYLSFKYPDCVNFTNRAKLGASVIFLLLKMFICSPSKNASVSGKIRLHAEGN